MSKLARGLVVVIGSICAVATVARAEEVGQPGGLIPTPIDPAPSRQPVVPPAEYSDPTPDSTTATPIELPAQPVAPPAPVAQPAPMAESGIPGADCEWARATVQSGTSGWYEDGQGRVYNERGELVCQSSVTSAEASLDDGYSPVAYQQFQSALSPYGQWYDVAPYGQVWAPSPSLVGYDFMPYSTAGYWGYSNYGWTWMSDYNWGWAPFHYGRWVTLSGYGWCWVPGSLWGPGWVSWRYGGGYAGWAPLAPRGVSVGPPGGIRSPGVVGNTTVGAPSATRSAWRFVVANDLGSRRANYLPGSAVSSVWAYTKPVGNLMKMKAGDVTVRYSAGPSAMAYSRTTGRSLSATTLSAARTTQSAVRAVPPRAGVPMAQRGWSTTTSQAMSTGARLRQPVTLGQSAQPQPSYSARTYYPPASAAPAPQFSVSTSQMRQPPEQPTYAVPQQAPSYAVPQHQYQAPSYAQPSYQAPSYAAPQRAYQMPSYSAPSYAAPQRSYQMPSYSAPSYSAPSYSAPQRSYQMPSYSAPAPSMSRPSFNAPAPSMSRPSFGGGGAAIRRR